MEAIKKIYKVKKDRIELLLPKQFWDQEVEVIILKSPVKSGNKSVSKSLRGILQGYSDPDMIS